MLRACKDKSVIFISHRLSSAVLADRIYMLENGEIVEAGSHSQLMNKNGKYAQMFRFQAENYVQEDIMGNNRDFIKQNKKFNTLRMVSNNLFMLKYIFKSFMEIRLQTVKQAIKNSLPLLSV